MVGENQMQQTQGTEEENAPAQPEFGSKRSGIGVETLQDRRSVLKKAGTLGVGLAVPASLSEPARAGDCTLPDGSNDQNTVNYIDKEATKDSDEAYYRPHNRYYSGEHRQCIVYHQGYQSNNDNFETEHVFTYHAYGMGSEGQLSDPYDPYPTIDETVLDIDLSTGEKVLYDPWEDLGGRPSPKPSEDFLALQELYTAASIGLSVSGYFNPISTAANLAGVIRGADEETDTHYWNWDYSNKCVSEHENTLHFIVPSTTSYVYFDLESITDCSTFNFSLSKKWSVYADYAGGDPYMSVY